MTASHRSDVGAFDDLHRANPLQKPSAAWTVLLLTTADVRVAKDLAVGRNLQLSLYGDLFNVTNAGTVVRSHDTFPIFAVPAEIISPMVFRVGVRVGF